VVILWRGPFEGWGIKSWSHARGEALIQGRKSTMGYGKGKGMKGVKKGGKKGGKASNEVLGKYAG
jgi:hypothetical protein